MKNSRCTAKAGSYAWFRYGRRFLQRRKELHTTDNLLWPENHRRFCFGNQPLRKKLFLQKGFPLLDIISGLLPGISLCGDPQQGFRSGETADDPALVVKADFASVCPVYAGNPFGKIGNLVLGEDLFLQFLFAGVLPWPVGCDFSL